MLFSSSDSLHNYGWYVLCVFLTKDLNYSRTSSSSLSCKDPSAAGSVGTACYVWSPGGVQVNALGNLWNEAWERRFPNNPLINHLRDHQVPFPHTLVFFFSLLHYNSHLALATQAAFPDGCASFFPCTFGLSLPCHWLQYSTIRMCSGQGPCVLWPAPAGGPPLLTMRVPGINRDGSVHKKAQGLFSSFIELWQIIWVCGFYINSYK